MVIALGDKSQQGLAASVMCASTVLVVGVECRSLVGVSPGEAASRAVCSIYKQDRFQHAWLLYSICPRQPPSLVCLPDYFMLLSAAFSASACIPV